VKKGDGFNNYIINDNMNSYEFNLAMSDPTYYSQIYLTMDYMSGICSEYDNSFHCSTFFLGKSNESVPLGRYVNHYLVKLGKKYFEINRTADFN
jgi:hypothetical protein